MRCCQLGEIIRRSTGRMAEILDNVESKTTIISLSLQRDWNTREKKLDDGDAGQMSHDGDYTRVLGGSQQPRLVVASPSILQYLETRGTWQLAGWAAAWRASQTTSARNRPIGNITLDTKPIVLIAKPSERGVQAGKSGKENYRWCVVE